ncbi:hypothetical protein C6499_06560 [Candidatus Poribacteria bacterium]|nr:MAG: hypothetical protein C6499_06560 [Candidatus Poribacteria bacterium]
MNGKPYYSADSGFACAAAGRGMTEALQEHLNVIVRDENLEIAFNDDYYQAEMKGLVEDKTELEEQKAQRQNAIKEATKELETKNIKLAELKVELDSPVEILETSEGSRMVELNEKIEEKISDMESKKAEIAKVEIELESPTRVELDALNTEGTIHQSSKDWFSKLRHWFSKLFTGLPKLIFTIFATAAVIGLFGYLYLFYVSAGEKTVKSSDDMDLTALIDYKALDRSLQFSDDNPRNWLILMFPFIFIVLAIVTHLSLESEKWTRWIYFSVFLAATLLIEATIGWRIAHNIVEAQKAASTNGQSQDSFRLLFLLFLFLGFGPSVLLGLGLHWILGLWENPRPQTDQSTQMEIQIRAEKKDKLVELSALNTEIQNLEEGLSRIYEDKQAYSDSLIKTYRHPIESQIAGLDTEIQSIQAEIQLLNEQVDSLQMEIDRCESEIGTHLKGQRERVIDIKKMEAQANEFVTGWCRYVAQCRTDLQPQEVSSQIIEIQELAKQTLENFKTTLKTV